MRPAGRGLAGPDLDELLVSARHLERNIKEVLDEFGEDKNLLKQLLTGKRVLLAEELSKCPLSVNLVST